MPRPTVTLPTWATTGTKLEPPTGKRALGWIVDEPPPAEWWNHLQYATGEWLTFLNAVILGEATSDLALRFAQSSAAADIVPLLAATSVPNGAYRLVARFPTTSPTIFASLYVGGSASRKFMLVYNASWNGTQWAQNSAAVAQAIAINTTNALEVLTHPASPASWNDSAWASGSFDTINVTTLNATSITATSGTFTATLFGKNTTCETLNATSYVNTDDLKVETSLHLTGPIDIEYELAAAAIPMRYLQLDIMRPIVWNVSPPEPLGTLEIYGTQGAVGNTHATNSVWVEYPVAVPRGTQKVTLELTWRAFGPTVSNLAKLVWWPRAMGATNPQPAPPNTYSQIGADLNLPGFTATDVYVTSATFTGLLVINGESRYSVLVKLAPASALYGIRLGFADPGARNG
jgi:hypothetical protein